MITVKAVIQGRELPVRLIQSGMDTSDFLRWAEPRRKALAVDTETTTHRRWTDPGYAPRLVQFADADSAWCLEPGNPAISEVLVGTRSLAFANAPFDIGVLSAMGAASEAVLWSRAHDVLVLAHLLDSRGRRLGGCPLDLKSLAAYVVEGRNIKEVLYAKGGVSSEKRDLREAAKEYGYRRAGDEYTVLPVNHPVYLRYSGSDALYTFHLARTLGMGVRKAGLAALYERERRFAAIVHRMEQRGFEVDQRHARDTATLLEDDLATMTAELLSDWGLVKPGSPAQVVEALQRHGVQWPQRTRKRRDGTEVEYTDTTRKGAPSTARFVLEDMDHPLASAVLDYRGEAKALTACVRPLLALTGSDGRVHPGFKTLGALTGRMSCRGPNLQQMPKRRGTASRMRGCLQAGEGMVIVAADLSQIEYRVAASLSRDPVMMQAFLDGEDLHVMAARLVFGTADPTEEQRSLAKAAGFGKIYGAGSATIARQTGATLQAAGRIVKRYSEHFEVLESWSQEVVADIEMQLNDGDASITTPYGRIIPADPERPYAAVNYVCQSTARDVLVDWVFALGSTDGMLAIVHDELVFEIAPGDAEDLARSLEKAAAEIELPGVPVVAGAKVGSRSWGSLYRSTKQDTDFDDTDGGAE